MTTFLDRVVDLEPGEYPSDEGTYRTSAGQLFRVTTDADEWMDLRDAGDWYGRAEFFEYRDGRKERPEGFDGGARKIDLRYGFLWWQPPTDALADPELLESLRRGLRDLADFGYKVVTVETLDAETDYYGRSIVRNGASLGGIEPFDEIGPMVRDLIAELEIDI